jgi:hypothetical protein
MSDEVFQLQLIKNASHNVVKKKVDRSIEFWLPLKQLRFLVIISPKLGHNATTQKTKGGHVD